MYTQINSIKHNKFTLLEMLIVIAIISVLAAIMVPSLNNSISLAREIYCTNNLKQIGSMLFMYCADDKSGRLPGVCNNSGRFLTSFLGSYAEMDPDPITGKMTSATSKTVFFCPSHIQVPTKNESTRYSSSYMATATDNLTVSNREGLSYYDKAEYIGGSLFYRGARLNKLNSDIAIMSSYQPQLSAWANVIGRFDPLRRTLLDYSASDDAMENLFVHGGKTGFLSSGGNVMSVFYGQTIKWGTINGISGWVWKF